jgi:hypothetical protein
MVHSEIEVLVMVNIGSMFWEEMEATCFSATLVPNCQSTSHILRQFSKYFILDADDPHL